MSVLLAEYSSPEAAGVYAQQSVTYSYPNYIPLSASAVDRIVSTVMPLPFDRIYSHFYHLVIEADAKAAIRRSVDRYRRAIGHAGQA